VPRGTDQVGLVDVWILWLAAALLLMVTAYWLAAAARRIRSTRSAVVCWCLAHLVISESPPVCTLCSEIRVVRWKKIKHF
jgi:hypothetical protein